MGAFEDISDLNNDELSRSSSPLSSSSSSICSVTTDRLYLFKVASVSTSVGNSLALLRFEGLVLDSFVDDDLDSIIWDLDDGEIAVKEEGTKEGTDGDEEHDNVGVVVDDDDDDDEDEGKGNEVDGIGNVKGEDGDGEEEEEDDDDDDDDGDEVGEVEYK